MASAIFKYILLSSSLLSTVLYASKLEDIFTESQLKRVKVVATVVVVAGTAYTVYKIGEYTVKTVKRVYREYQQYKLNQQYAEICQKQQNLNNGISFGLEQTNKIRNETTKTQISLNTTESMKKNTLSSLDRSNKNFDDSQAITENISEIQEESKKMLSAFHQTAKTNSQKISEHAIEKEKIRKQEKDIFERYKTKSIKDYDPKPWNKVELLLGDTHEQLQKTNAIASHACRIDENLANSLDKILSDKAAKKETHFLNIESNKNE